MEMARDLLRFVNIWRTHEDYNIISRIDYARLTYTRAYMAGWLDRALHEICQRGLPFTELLVK